MWSRLDDLRRANAADIPAIMEIERQPGYDRLVGRWNEQEHHRNLSTPGYLYLVLDDANGRPQAFVALSGMGSSSGDVMINRFIVRDPGTGVGSALLARLIRLVFEGSPARRLMLRVATYNERAIHVYRQAGFREERLLPKGGRRPDGAQVDLMLMSLAWAD
ncbi:diamine N-acetyltransferase [Rhizobium sp. SG_E_25_P2]|uniref:GNAT family N-acetyltransferase n=1 Tax=Rhizobium sp. SG_E_25_P2 TaxID=2879942 RepID=UPI002473B17A|nr:GNAT family N-acetyltransferase [Rhizobium sp. SG_E_25_P2]MDH6266478.1 diamine N-acetyltransferase [Rhizobium sp. SG_E_25_P2]